MVVAVFFIACEGDGMAVNGPVDQCTNATGFCVASSGGVTPWPAVGHVFYFFYWCLE